MPIRFPKIFLYSVSKLTLVACAYASFALVGQSARLNAQDNPASFGGSLAVPVFEQVDQNGVDLFTGVLRTTSPTYSAGTEGAPVVFGLQWTGQGWVFIGVPSVWNDDGKYIVNYNGYSDEFNGYKQNFSQREPVNGALLSCNVFLPSKLTSLCNYTSRDGDKVTFRNYLSPFSVTFDQMGLNRLPFGNMAIENVFVDSVERANSRYQIGTYDDALFGWTGGDTSEYFDSVYVLNAHGGTRARHRRVVNIVGAGGRLEITTPNHNDNLDDHFLRPKNTTQTIKDVFGAVWKYTINNNREITLIDPPGGAANVAYTYGSNHRVATVTTADGVWRYSYSDAGQTFGNTFSPTLTVTRTDPQGNVIAVRSHKDHNYIIQYVDELNRVTNYTHTNQRLTRITYPEGNYTSFAYDARGNISQTETYGKPGSNTPPIIQWAGYDATCSDPQKCNKPNYIVDGNGGRTDFEYTNGLPTKITSPAPTPGAPRPEIRNKYHPNHGVLTQSSYCMTGSNCANTADEVRTDYDYGGTEGGKRMLFGMAVTSGSQTLRTCYTLDASGRRIGETPPRADLASCNYVIPGGAVLTPPSAGTPVVIPTYPDGTTGGAAPPPPLDGNPPFDPCSGASGDLQCQ
jgi:YD repeat-containing protein